MKFTQESLLKILAEKEKLSKEIESRKNIISDVEFEIAQRELMIDSLNEMVINGLRENNQNKVEFDHVRAVIPKPRQSVSIDDESKIPEKFFTVSTPKPVRKLDKKALTKAIKDGEEIEGAGLVDGKPTLKLEEI